MAEALHPRDVARILSEIGTLMEMNGREPFRARAFTSAARLLEGTDADLAALARADRLTELRGIGPGLAGVVKEIVETGRSTPHEELTAATPVGLFELLRVPGLGPKRIHTLHAELGIESLEALEEAARAGRLSRLPGIGGKTEQKILEGLAFARASRARRRYPEALEVAVRVLEWLRSHEAVLAADIAGALRRRLEVVDRVDLVAASEDPARVEADLGRLNGVAGDAEHGSDGALELPLSDGLTLRLRLVPLERYVGAMVWETGSDPHRDALAERATERGLRLDPLGLWRGESPVEVEDEEALYSALGLAYVPPELREGLGEVEAAASGRAPELVTLDDLRGTFHCHTTFSDGKATLEELAEAAGARGWAYLGIADHSRSAGYARGLSIERVGEQHAEIDALNAGAAATRLRLLRGIESDILPDGSLDYPEDVLRSFDYVIGSVHSGFRMSEPEMTARIIRAVRNPALTILGHPTGRLLLTREGYPVDVSAVIAAAAEAGVVIEINSNPHRLDLDWREIRRAALLGVIVAINPDAHSVAALEHVVYGVNMARKAGLGPRQILNCWELDEIEAFLRDRRRPNA